ncbi:MAG TPA: hypothetical protein VFN71_16345 [Methylomirabilota bacterium]|nr:hypothetical protein [Methylomirabilota bacterium]
MFEYLLDHPEFATHVTRALRLARYRIWRDGDRLAMDDGWGTTGEFRVVHAERGLRIMHARGRYEPGFLPDINGEAVAVIRYEFRPDGQGHTLVAPSVAGYVRLDSGFLRTVGRIGGPFIQRKADKEAGKLLKVFMRVSRAIVDEPAQVFQRLSERPEVPRQELEEFRRLLRLP